MHLSENFCCNLDSDNAANFVSGFPTSCTRIQWFQDHFNHYKRLRPGDAIQAYRINVPIAADVFSLDSGTANYPILFFLKFVSRVC